MKYHRVDNSNLHSPCHDCPNKEHDKLKEPCDSCKFRVIYDALLCGISRTEVDGWFEKPIMAAQIEAPVYRCSNKGCFRRVKRQSDICTRCQRVRTTSKLETKREILQTEKTVIKFINFCTKTYPNLLTAAKHFGADLSYLYYIRSFDVYPSAAMLSAMRIFMEKNGTS